MLFLIWHQVARERGNWESATRVICLNPGTCLAQTKTQKRGKFRMPARPDLQTACSYLWQPLLALPSAANYSCRAGLSCLWVSSLFPFVWTHFRFGWEINAGGKGRWVGCLDFSCYLHCKKEGREKNEIRGRLLLVHLWEKEKRSRMLYSFLSQTHLQLSLIFLSSWLSFERWSFVWPFKPRGGFIIIIFMSNTPTPKLDSEKRILFIGTLKFIWTFL